MDQMSEIMKSLLEEWVMKYNFGVNQYKVVETVLLVPEELISPREENSHSIMMRVRIQSFSSLKILDLFHSRCSG